MINVKNEKRLQSRWWRGCRTHLLPQTHQKYIYMWKNSYWILTGDNRKTLVQPRWKERYRQNQVEREDKGSGQDLCPQEQNQRKREIIWGDSSLGSEQSEPLIEFPSPGVWQKEEEFCWLIRGPAELTGGLWKTHTLPMRSEGMAVCLQSGAQIADWNHEVGRLVSRDSTSTHPSLNWGSVAALMCLTLQLTLEGWLRWPWTLEWLRLQAASALREEARQWHRQCIRSRHISDTGSITTPSELTLVKYPVSPSCSSTGPLGEEGAGVLNGKSTHLKGTEPAWAWILGLGFQNLGPDPAPNRCVTVTEQWESPISHPVTVFSAVQLLSCVHLFATPWTAACQASLSITNSQSLLKFISIESVMPTNHLILCLLLLLPPSNLS